MPPYTVQAAAVKKTWDDKPAKVLALTLQAEGQEPISGTAYDHSGNFPLPEVGSKMDIPVPTPNDYGGLDIKLPRRNVGGGSGWRPKSPEELAADRDRQKMIVRQHSQTTAMRWAEFAHLRGTLPENFTIKDLAAVIDHFYNDAMGVAERTSPKA